MWFAAVISDAPVFLCSLDLPRFRAKPLSIFQPTKSALHHVSCNMLYGFRKSLRTLSKCLACKSSRVRTGTGVHKAAPQNPALARRSSCCILIYFMLGVLVTLAGIKIQVSFRSRCGRLSTWRASSRNPMHVRWFRSRALMFTEHCSSSH